MIKHPSRRSAKRFVAGASAVAAATAGLGVALASPALAAATSITATPNQTAYPAKADTTATIAIKYTGTLTSTNSLRYQITAGADASSTSTQCTVTDASAGTATCTFNKTNATVTTDTFRVWDDVDGGGAYNSGEPTTTGTLRFTGAPQKIALTPETSTVRAGAPRTFTVSGTDTGGNPSAGRTVAITTSTTAGTTTVNATPVTLKQDGTGTFTVSNSTAATVTITATSTDNNGASDKSTLTVTGTNGGQPEDLVTTLTATPTTQTGDVNGSLSYTVTATDGTDPVPNATVQYFIDGVDATAAGTYPSCGDTNASGKLTCTIDNEANKAGTDNITFFVNKTLGSPRTTGLDSDEASAKATAVFAAQPAYTDIQVTCPDQTDNNAASYYCGIPVNTASTPITATVVYDDPATAANDPKPVSGATVRFTTSADAEGNEVTLSAVAATTNAAGVATITATTTDKTSDGDFYVYATVGNGSSYVSNGDADENADSNYAFVDYQTPYAQAPVLTPQAQSKLIGGSASVTGTVKTQFGAPVSGRSLAFAVSGRNTTAQNLTTNASGQVAFTYSDQAAATNTTVQDTITVNDVTVTPDLSPNAKQPSSTAFVNWLSSVTPAAVNLGLGSVFGQCVPTSATTDDSDTAGVNDYYADSVCYTVYNSTSGDTQRRVAGTPVTITVDKGFVNTGNEDDVDLTRKTVSDTADEQGSGRVVVGSVVSGVQTITVTAGGVSTKATITYSAGEPTSFALTPETATVTPGGSQAFTATAKDEYGNGVPGYRVTFTQNGPGALNNSSAFTSSAGTASIILQTAATDSGNGSVSASLEDSNLTDSSAYSVQKPAGPASIVGSIGSGTVTDGTISVKATVKDASGKALANQPVSFKLSGASTASGTANTNASGVATFSATAAKAGAVSAAISSGGKSTTAKGTIGKRTVTLKLVATSGGRGIIKLTSTVGVKKAGVRMYLTRVGGGTVTPTTNSAGVIVTTHRGTPGASATFRAIVSDANYVSSKVVLTTKYPSK